jgi:hypothetical protein
MPEDNSKPLPSPSSGRGGTGNGRPPSRVATGPAPEEAKGTIVEKRGGSGLFKVKLDSGNEVSAYLLLLGRQDCIKLGSGNRVLLHLAGDGIHYYIVKRYR